MSVPAVPSVLRTVSREVNSRIWVDAATVVTSKDPLPKLQQALVSAGVLNDTLLAEIEADAQRRIEEAVATVKAAPLLAPEVALQDLYA